MSHSCLFWVHVTLPLFPGLVGVLQAGRGSGDGGVVVDNFREFPLMLGPAEGGRP